MFRRTFAISVLALLSSAGCASSQTALIKSGTTLTDADLALGSATKANRDAGGFSESVHVRGVLDDGGFVYARLFVTNLATADQMAKMNVSIAPAGMAPAKVTIRRERGKWSTKGGALDVTIPEVAGVSASIEGDTKVVRWAAANAAVRITITLTTTVAPMSPSGGSADFGKGKYFATTLIAPHARLEVKVTTKTGDQPTERVHTGWAFAEKRTGNVAPYMMAKRFVDVRDVDKNGTFALSAFQRSSIFGGKTQGWLVCVRDGEVLVDAPRLTVRTEALEPHVESGYGVPRLVHFQGLDDAAIKGVVKANKRVAVYDDFKNLSKFERAIAERFAKPWTFRFLAHWALRSPQGKMSGNGFYSYSQLK